MFRFICLLILSVILVGLIPDLAIAQGGREERSSRFISFIDRNNNGVLEPTEFDRLPGRLRESLEGAGLDTSRSMSRQEFERFMPQLMEKMRSRREEGTGAEGRKRPMVFRVSPTSISGSTGSTGNVIVSGEDQKAIQVTYGTIQPGKGGRGVTSTSGKSSSSSKKENGKPTRTTVDLNQEFTPHDLDQDGQIGLYEWRKNNPGKLADFFVMDLNGDGFLTPREIQLSKAGKTQRSAASFMFALNHGQPDKPDENVAKTEASSKSSSSSPSTTKKNVPTATTNKTTSSSTDPVSNQAKYFFKLLDRNKDNNISAEEWKKSRSMRRMFEGANIDLTQSMTQTQFVEHYVTIKKK